MTDLPRARRSNCLRARRRWGGDRTDRFGTYRLRARRATSPRLWAHGLWAHGLWARGLWARGCIANWCFIHQFRTVANGGRARGRLTHTSKKNYFFLFYYFSPPDFFFKKTYCVGGQAGFGQTTAAVVALVQLHAGHSVLQVQLGQL